MRHVRSRLLAGVVFLLPAVLTLYLVALLFGAVDRAFTDQALALLERGSAQPGRGVVWLSRIVALLVVALAVYTVGLIATNVVGRRMLSAGEHAVVRVPVVGGVYRSFRQLLEAFGPQGRGAFRRCVVVEYPRPGIFRLGFVTNQAPRELGDPGRPHVAVFVPNTPPTSGILLLVAPGQYRDLGISTEEGIKMVMSGGMVMPDRLEPPADAGLPARG